MSTATLIRAMLEIANALTLDEQRIASNITKLPSLVSRRA